MEDRFDHDRFAAGLEESGLRLRDSRTLGRDYGWFLAEKPAD
jgi:hypothetical protein